MGLNSMIESISYLGDCTLYRFRDIQSFDESSKQITASTFRKKIGPDAWNWLSFKLDYCNDNHVFFNSNLRLSTDCHVRFYAGTLRDQKVAAVIHSGFHHFFKV